MRALLTPKTRLDAELGWLPLMAPAAAKEVGRKLAAGETGSGDELLGKLGGLDEANVAAHLCAYEKSRSFWIYPTFLISAYEEFDEQSLAEALAQNRQVSGFQKIDKSMLSSALSDLRKRHARAALNVIKRNADPGDQMLLLMSEYVPMATNGHQPTKSSRNVDLLIEAIAQEYDAWSEAGLRKISDEIDQLAAKLRSTPAASGIVEDITSALKRWDKISQPMQVLEQAKGHDEPRSRKIYEELRGLCLWLANDKKSYEPALGISRALQDTFPELPSVSVALSDDVETLEGLVEEARKTRVFEPMLNALGGGDDEALGDLETHLMGSGFGPTSSGRAKLLYDAFERCMAAVTKTEDEAILWHILRAAMLRMNNERNAQRAALALGEGLDRHSNRPPAEMASQFKEDLLTIRGNVALDDATALLARKETSEAIKVIDRALSLGVADDQSNTLRGIRSVLRRRAAVRKIKLAIGAAVAIGIAYAIYSDNSSSRYSPSYNSSSSSYSTPSYNAPSAPTYSAPAQPTYIDDFSELRPAIGTNNTLSIAELRYCQFQKERLEYIRLKATDQVLAQFNAAVDDYNLRCSSFRYMPADLSAVQASTVKYKMQINASADRLLASWGQSGSNAWQPSPPPSPGVDTSSSDWVGGDTIGDQGAGEGVADDNDHPVKYDLSTAEGATAVQARLRDLGFYQGKVDGHWNQGSKDALAAWKKSAGFDQDDRWDWVVETMLMQN